MSGIKIYPPNQLPAEGVSDVQFKIWKEELEVYLETEDKFEKFMAGGRYEDWQPAENNENRIATPKGPDEEADLPKIRKDLRQFITLVAKYVHMDYYNPIIRHSTSLKWIYNKIREDYDIQQQGVHFLNILDLVWDPTGQTTPVGFYNNYRSLILGNLARRGDEIKWKNTTLTEDEKLSPSHEDLILLNVLTLIHPKLPAYVKEHYGHKMGQTMRLMDFKTEILTKAKQYIADIENPQISAVPTIANNYIAPTPDINYIQTRPFPRSSRHPFPQQGYRPRFTNPRPQFQPKYSNPNPNPSPNPYLNPRPSNPGPLPPFCRICHIAGLPRSVYTSHYLGDAQCRTLSQKDKQQLATRTSGQLGAAMAEEEEEEDDIAAEYGYSTEEFAQVGQQYKRITSQPSDPTTSPVSTNPSIKVQIENNHVNQDSNSEFFRKEATCNFIQPVPAQTLTVKDSNNKNIHMDLDTGATVSYAKLSTVLSHGFKIYPNSQLSNLADGKTKMSAVGEINETFFRNNWEVKFHAIVTENLHTDFVAGNNFIKSNEIIQDIAAKTITVHKKYNVPETNKLLIMPTEPNNILVQNNHISVLLPDQNLNLQVPHADNTVLAVEPWFQSNLDWPPPQLCTVEGGVISIKNNSGQPIHVKKNATKVQVRTTTEECNINKPYQVTTTCSPGPSSHPNIESIEINTNDINPSIIQRLKYIHETNKEVFNNDLTGGYNMAYGKHICRLNWSDHNRPQASKVHTVNYDHQTKQLLQEVCDDFTELQVLGIPQQDDVQIQHVSPCFLVRKQRAKNKPKSSLTKDDVRLVVNFGQLNDFLKNMPTPITKSRDIFTQLGKWKYLISLDLYQGFYQNHMSSEDAPWLAISTPFGGLRYMKRSGQGLIGQSEELDELLSKILREECSTGKAARIADDLYVGGETQQETLNNYEQVLTKLNQANLKVSPNKTKIFLKSVDVLGWVWQQGGFLAPSPHRVNALQNTKKDDIKTVRDMRSYIGLYKTLLPASKNLTVLLDPFDRMVADRESKEPFIWDRQLEQAFIKTTAAVADLQTLYLPHPSDQLMIVVDAAKTQPGIGHTLYAIKDNKKLPVAFHSVKLQQPYDRWLPCELEALAFATAITSEYHIIKETKLPVIISPDSKAVADAVKLIKKGNFSTNPRIQSLITNVNRVPIIVQMASGKSELNSCADFQSRHPSICTAEQCAICSFVKEKSTSILDPFAINAINPTEGNIPFQNKDAWNKIQDQDKACYQTKSLLLSGKTPNKRSGKTPSEIRRLCSIAKVNNKNLLIVPMKTNKYSAVTTELTVVPSQYLPAILWQLHNLHNHPTKSQLKSIFDKAFYSVGLSAQLDTIYNECYFCATQKKLPDPSPQQSRTEAHVPGTHFHADVIRRQSQYILTVRDHFSSYTCAKIIRAENNKELKTGIIELIQPIRLAGEVLVRVDNATGFKPLLDNKDHDLDKLKIKVQATDQFNKNANAVIDKACLELEQELKRIEPDGRPISSTTLNQAISVLNQRLRRKGNISAYEIHFNRDMFQGTNLNLNYEELRSDQLKTRNIQNDRANINKPTVPNKVNIGDAVIIRSERNKHAAKDIYVITDKEEQSVTMQKIIHPHNKESANLRSKTYKTDYTRVAPVKSCQYQLQSASQHQPQSSKKTTTARKSAWNPIQSSFYADSDEDGSATKSIKQRQQTLQNINQPVIPIPPPLPRIIIQRPNVINVRQRPPQIYAQLEEWAHRQRAAAQQQLHTVEQEEVEPEPEQLNTVEQKEVEPEPVKPVSKRESQKQAAKNKIAKIYNVKIPQIDGDTITPTTSSSEASPDTSATEQVTHSLKNLQELYQTCDNLLSISSVEIEPMEPWSPSVSTTDSDTEFNFDEFERLEQEIFSPDFNQAFYLDPLDITADASMTIEANRVYKMDKLLESLNPDQPLSPLQKKKVSKWRKLYRRLLRTKKGEL